MVFWRKKKEKRSISDVQGLPDGMFRCDLCGRIQPIEISGVSNLAGAIANGGVTPPEAYTVCAFCAFSGSRHFDRFPNVIIGMSPTLMVSIGPQHLAFVQWDTTTLREIREYLQSMPAPEDFKEYLQTAPSAT